MKPRCLFVMDAEFFPQAFGPDELSRLGKIVDLAGPAVNGATLRSGNYQDIELIIGSWGMPQMNGALLARLPRLKVLFYAAGTIKSITTDASWARGIRVTNAALENAKPTAEFTLAEIILSLKRTWERIFLLREKQKYQQRNPLVQGAYGSTVGLLALGKVGKQVAQRLASLDVRVIAYDPVVPAAEATELGVRLCSLEEVFAQSDVVSCHMPSTVQTRHLLGRELFSSMKRGATFINTARGNIVKESELIDVLRDRPDIFAVLDVTDPEPPPADSPLFKLPNVVLTPHIAGSIGLECRRMGRMMVDEVERYLTNRPLLGELRPEQLEILA
ncbi:MAG TPA: hydroxyacid dehydrogenase [Candidatus Didemnitutus sp.]|nr:hydroxyacid dehydrogenase [Candidatus Didemnitutus sp.]